MAALLLAPAARFARVISACTLTCCWSELFERAPSTTAARTTPSSHILRGTHDTSTRDGGGVGGGGVDGGGGSPDVTVPTRLHTRLHLLVPLCVQVFLVFESEGQCTAWKVMEGHGRSWKVMEGHGRVFESEGARTAPC